MALWRQPARERLRLGYKPALPAWMAGRCTAAGLHAEIAGPGEDGRERVIGFDYTRCVDER